MRKGWSWVAAACALAFAAALASCSGDDGGRDGAPADGAPADGAPDDGAATDGGSEDAGGFDAGARDGGGTDAGPRDAGSPDGGAPATVDVSTLDRKLMMGYQGWFSAEGDGSTVDRWRHWAPGATPNATNVQFDAWPDLSEFDASELFDTSFTYADGTAAGLYSAYTPSTVDRHFRWMREYGMDGVFLQHFVVELGDGTPARAFRDRVMRNVVAGAEAHGRAFAVMYDISGADGATLVARIQDHWRWLVDDEGITRSDRHLRHRGRPLVAVWGFGFDGRPGTPAQANELLQWWQTDGAPRYRATVVGGIPSNWRTLDGDSKAAAAWADVYRRFDVMSPWLVGRFGDDAGARSWRADRVQPDIDAASAAGADYMPVVWPGFSWANLMDGAPFNQIPRRGGRFWWTQLYEHLDAGATMIYGAMFDEVDEATAMFKLAETDADTPTTGQFLTMDEDGESLPSDWYLRLAGEGARMLRGERALTATRPDDPLPGR